MQGGAVPSIFWTGKLSFPMKLTVNINNLFAWISGNARDTTAMKDRMRKGYEGAITDHVTGYDHQGHEHYTKIAAELLKGIGVQGKEVLDVGCGTGILTHLARERGPSKIVCGDNSEYMLNQCRKKASDKGVDSTRMEFRQLDAELLPFDDCSFDAVISGMALGLVPNQKKAVKEMARVLCWGVCLHFQRMVRSIIGKQMTLGLGQLQCVMFLDIG
jgi:ubiquinone/menaquinone biosynthesis C-methylase UbiE